MTQQEIFENLLNNPESSILDYKMELYKFSNDNNDATSKFAKDIISFANTIRSKSAYIIFGIKERDGKLDFVGLENGIDDAILQNKLKDKVYPRPIFSYSPIHYQEKLFGLLEIPVHKYELPITPTQQLKGLEIGKVYYRNGTANTEATGIDVIRINDWFKTIKGGITNNLNEEISKILLKAVQNNNKISTILAELLPIANNQNLNSLKEFIEAELQGIQTPDHEKFDYRIQNVFLAFNEINVSPFSMINVTSEVIKNELIADKDTYQKNFFFPQPIITIESYVELFQKDKKTTYATFKVNSKDILDIGNTDMNVYIFENNIFDMYNNIRQRLIDLLMKI